MERWFSVGAGIAFLAITVLMIWFGRPRQGRAHTGVLASDTAAMFYILVALLCLVLAASLILTGLA